MYEGEGVENAVEFVETLRYVFPDTVRSDIENPNLRRIHLASGGSELTVVDGRTTQHGGTGFTRYTDMLLCRSRPVLKDRLARRGVDIEVSSLGRFEGRVDFVLGARYPDPTAPQLWVDRETLRPVRWLLAAGGGQAAADALDIRYLLWKSTAGVAYPGRIAFFRGQRLVREILVDEIVVDPEFDADLFDADRLRALYAASLPSGGDGGVAAEDMTEIREAIEAFRKIYE